MLQSAESLVPAATLADRLGRKPAFIGEMLLLALALVAATGKIGAVLTAFFFPSLLATWGTERLLPLLALTCLVGALITWIYRIETTGMDMESI